MDYAKDRSELVSCPAGKIELGGVIEATQERE